MLARSFCAFQAGSSRGRARVHGSLARGQLAAGAGAWVVVLRAAPGVRPTPLLAETLAKDRVAQPRERQGPLPSVRTGPYGREGPLSGAMPGPAAPGSGPVLGRGPSCAARAASLSVICGVPPFSLIFSPTHPTPVPISSPLNRDHTFTRLPRTLSTLPSACPPGSVLRRGPSLAAASPSDLALFAGCYPS